VEIPPELARLLATSPAAKPAPTTAHGAPRKARAGKGAAGVEETGPIAEGLRNDTLTSLAGAMRRRGSSADEILARLRTVNAERCVPPLDDKDLVTIAASVARYDPEPDGGFNLTDAGNAELFASRHGDAVRFDHRHDRWLVWNGHTWGGNGDGVLTRLAIACARTRYEEAGRVDDKDYRKKVIAWAFKSESAGAINAMLNVAQALRPVADDGSSWNPDPYLLGVENGVVDLRAGELRAGKPDDRVTRVAGCPYDPYAEAPRWERFLVEVFPDEALRAWVQLAVGYSLTGDTSEQCFFLCYGSGANGKSKFFNALERALGQYARAVPFAIFEASRADAEAASPILASLDSVRFITASEPRENTRLDEGRVKQLTGEGQVTARPLYKRDFTYQPRFHIWFCANHKPKVSDDSDAFWRRVRMVAFTQKFEGDAIDPFLEQTLAAEAAGILRWAVAGAAAWYKARVDAGGHLVLTSVPGGDDLTREWRGENDPLQEFLNDRCVEDWNMRVEYGALYADYEAWCNEAHVPYRERLSRTSFIRRLTPRYEHGISGGRRFFKGLGLISDKTLSAPY
jgi:putative DNA primase/helicase